MRLGCLAEWRMTLYPANHFELNRLANYLDFRHTSSNIPRVSLSADYQNLGLL